MSSSQKKRKKPGGGDVSPGTEKKSKAVKPASAKLPWDYTLKFVRETPFRVKITPANSASLHAKLLQSLPTISLFSPEWFLFVFNDTWYDVVEECMLRIEHRVAAETRVLCPPRQRIWRWAELIPDPMDVRVVIMGQDPYTTLSGDDTPIADGLAFSVSFPGDDPVMNAPPSLVNILRAARKASEQWSLYDDGDANRTSVFGHVDEENVWYIDEVAVERRSRVRRGDLEWWAMQGVLLLNNVLTAPGGRNSDCANSHKDFGWQFVTDAVIRRLGSSAMPHKLFFMLWGWFAKKSKLPLICREQKDDGRVDVATPKENTTHRVFTCHHPSPISVNKLGEFPYDQFYECNSFLHETGRDAICWFWDPSPFLNRTN